MSTADGTAIRPDREGYAHDALVALDPGADPAAPGAAVTVELCGDWEHEPPCRWPHHTGGSETADGLQLRILFAAGADEEPVVRQRIVDALRAGVLDHSGRRASWQLVTESPAAVDEDERHHVDRLTRS